MIIRSKNPEGSEQMGDEENLGNYKDEEMRRKKEEDKRKEDKKNKINLYEQY